MTSSDANDSDPHGDEDSDATNSEYTSSSDGCNSSEEDDASMDTTDGEGETQSRKKRVTKHWRTFIRPLMWRCRWIEVRMNELRCQALRYEKKLAMYTQQKEQCSKMVESDTPVSRSVPLVSCRCENKTMKRRKRKRKEDNVHISSYMSDHSIFSYYENKRAETDCHSVDGDNGDEVDDYKESDNHGSRADDSALEEILLDIGSLQSRLLNMNARIKKLTTENTKEIYSTQGNVYAEQPILVSPCSSPPNNEELMTVGVLNSYVDHISEYEMEDSVMSGNTASIYGDAKEEDTVASTIRLLSSAAMCPDEQGNAYFEGDNADDYILMNNYAAVEGSELFEMVGNVRKKPEKFIKEVASSIEDDSTLPETSTQPAGLQNNGMRSPASEDRALPLLMAAYIGKQRGRKGLKAGASNPRTELN